MDADQSRFPCRCRFHAPKQTRPNLDASSPSPPRVAARLDVRPQIVRSVRASRDLCRGLDLGQLLALLEAALLLEAHDLEADKVGQVLPHLDLSPALVPVGLLPLLVDLGLGPGLLDGAGASATGERLDDEGRQEGVRKGQRLAGDGELGVLGGAIDKDLLITHMLMPGPSLRSHFSHSRAQRTRLWSMISTMVARRPA